MFILKIEIQEGYSFISFIQYDIYIVSRIEVRRGAWGGQKTSEFSSGFIKY